MGHSYNKKIKKEHVPTLFLSFVLFSQMYTLAGTISSSVKPVRQKSTHYQKRKREWATRIGNLKKILIDLLDETLNEKLQRFVDNELLEEGKDLRSRRKPNRSSNSGYHLFCD